MDIWPYLSKLFANILGVGFLNKWVGYVHKQYFTIRSSQFKSLYLDQKLEFHEMDKIVK